MRDSSLLDRDLSLPLACLTRDFADFRNAGNPHKVSGEEFLAHAAYLADRLPDTQQLINLAQNRYLFLLTLAASLLRGKTCLIPQNRTPRFKAFLSRRYPHATAVYDHGEAHAHGFDLSCLDVFGHSSAPAAPIRNPRIQDEHPALVCFTSGSTGDPKPVAKTWKTLRESSRINRRYFCAEQGVSPVFHYAGVPPQHMWGLETSIFLPLFSNVCMVDAHAELPGDLMRQLATLPQPLTFIATPLHLRSLQALRQTAPEAPVTKLHRVLCATSPLDEQLAKQIEQLFCTEVHEVYGCSEVGSMAHRRSAQESSWELFDGIDYQQHASGDTIASAAHLDQAFTLGDRIHLLSDGRFRLAGRSDDMVKVAGKRGSLGEVTKTLLRFEKLNDGAVFLPEEQTATPRLTAIVSLQEDCDPTATKTDLVSYLRKNLDAAFVPRPIYIVPQLPRQANGKLSRTALLELYEQLRRDSTRRAG